jgi:hypothetical protein
MRLAFLFRRRIPMSATDLSGKSNDQLRQIAAGAKEEAATETNSPQERSDAGDAFVAANKELNDRGED